ncbi:MAG: MobA/MobL family protein [Ruminococcus sp.]|nr:MobA/MobL family protein [Ruminococcus sp.]
MAIYHMSIKIGSKGKGQSAVAAAAYRSGDKLTDKETGLISDYTRKGGVVHSEISLCDNAPLKYADRETLWNAVHAIENKKNSRLWREFEVALPKEFSQDEQIETVRDFVKQLTDSGMCADWSLHDKRDGNPHAHIMATVRSITNEGEWAPKSRLVYDLDENGERIFQKLNKQGYKQYKSHKEDYNNWNAKERVEEWRAAWANQTEEAFVIPDGIEVIGSCAFASATNLKKVVFPETVKVIGERAFYGCNFETIDFLPDSLEKICDGAFAYNESLKAVTIPKNVTELEYMFFGPFGYCVNLEEVTFERENPKMHQSADSTHSPDDKEYFDTFYEGSEYGLGADLGHLVYYFPDNSFDIYAGALSYYDRDFYKISMKDYKPSFSTPKQDITGDANGDGQVSMADAVTIMQYISNPNKYGENGTDKNHITEQGKKNADIAGENDGITNADALAIQKKLLKLD